MIRERNEWLAREQAILAAATAIGTDSESEAASTASELVAAQETWVTMAAADGLTPVEAAGTAVNDTDEQTVAIETLPAARGGA